MVDAPDYEYNEEALPFVLFNSVTNKFEINEETREYLKTLQGPIGVLSVAGMYRSGKSYLLNRVLLNRSRGFDVGHTINACTKGVWIWGKPIDGITPDGDPIKVLVLDTEGLGATDEEQNHDVRIFSLAILLASYFIYNSQQSIDETKLNDLSLVINLTKNIQIKAGGGNEDADPEEYAAYFPSLMWVVRDFTLQLVDQDSEPITSKDYLEKALQNQKGFSEAIDKKNRIRRLLKSFFKERDCCTMIRPLTKEDQLQNLADIPLDNLRPEFVEQVHTLRRKVINRIKPKQLNNKPLNGEMLYNLAKSYVDSINSGAVPSIESSWSYICKNECQKAMMDAYQVFEKLFYDAFSERCPMLEVELKQIYKTAKQGAMVLFHKTAVGEVKDTFHTQLKDQMNQKLELYSMENEKTSDQECQNFLQRNYNTIAQKLNNDEYDSLESLNFEILGFLNYFIEEGPKGPNAQSIAQQFCYDRLADGANFFNESTKRHLMLQTQLAEQAQVKLKQDLTEIKDEKRKLDETFNSKLRYVEQQKAELAAREETTRESLAQALKERERIELDSEDKLNQLRKDMAREKQEVTERMNSSLEKQKEIARFQKASDSEYDKQRALFQQQIEHLTQKTQQQDEKEKQLIQELKEQKVETVTNNNETKGKFELEIRSLTQKVKELSEQVFELENQQKDDEQNLTIKTQEWNKREQMMDRELLQLREAKDDLTKSNKKLQSRFDVELAAKSQEQEQEDQVNTERIQELEEIVKDLEDQNESMKSQSVKDTAVAKQKNEFMRLQLEQEQKQKEEMKLNHERILKSFRDNERQSVIGKEEVKNQINELSQAHQDEIQQLTETYMGQVQERETVISNLTESLSKAELQLTLSVEDFKKEVEQLREALQQTEDERDKYLALSEKQNQQHEKTMENTMERMQDKIQELEEQLEEKEEQLQTTINEIDQSSQMQLAELKKFYDSEKVRFDQRLNEVREQGNKRLTETEIDYKNQILFQQEEAEEIQSQQNEEIQHLTDSLNQACTTKDSQIALLSQQLEAFDKQLHERNEQLERTQDQAQAKLDQQMEGHANERRELIEKNEFTVDKVAELERQKITLENQIESQRNLVHQKEKILNETKEEYEMERIEIQEKYNEVRGKLEGKEDELNYKNINYEKDGALMKQQIKFAESKAAEMQTQYDRTVQRYEDRIKIDKEEMQRELKDRSQRLLEEKEAAEAKYQAKRKELKEVEKRLIQMTSSGETEQAVLQQKFSNLESEREKLISNYEAEISNLREANEHMTKNLEDSKVTTAYSYEQLRRELDNSTTELQEQRNLLDKERALWEGRFQFLESQRDQSKADLEELQKKFQQSLELQQKMHFDNKSNAEQTHSSMIQQLEAKYAQRMREQQDRVNQDRNELSQKVKALERDKSHLTERLELQSRDQLGESSNLNKRYEKEKELNERLGEELDLVKQEKEKKVLDLQAKLDKERENFNNRKREVEQRAARAETKQTQLMLGHEAEKATWDTKMTEFKHQIDELKSKNDRLQANLEAKEQQIGRLQQENKQARRNYMTAQKNTDTAMGGAVGGSILNKLNLQGLGGGPGGNVMASMQGLGKAAGGYQPKMFGAKAATSELDSGNTSERSFAGRFGAANNVSASIDVPASHKFLAQSIQGKYGGSTFAQPNDAQSDASSVRNNVYATPVGIRNPQSRKSVVEDDDIPNTDEFPQQ